MRSNEDLQKEEHAYFAVAIWEIFGVYALFTGKIHGLGPYLVFFSTYFLIGAGIASIASILTFLPRVFIAKITNTPVFASSPQGLFSILSNPIYASFLSLLMTALNVWWIVSIASFSIKIINGFFPSQ